VGDLGFVTPAPSPGPKWAWPRHNSPTATSGPRSRRPSASMYPWISPKPTSLSTPVAGPGTTTTSTGCSSTLPTTSSSRRPSLPSSSPAAGRGPRQGGPLRQYWGEGIRRIPDLALRGRRRVPWRRCPRHQLPQPEGRPRERRCWASTVSAVGLGATARYLGGGALLDGRPRGHLHLLAVVLGLTYNCESDVGCRGPLTQFVSWYEALDGSATSKDRCC